MSKLGFSLNLLTLLLAACSPQATLPASAAGTSASMLAEASPTVKPTADTLPESLSTQMPVLEKAGYSLQQSQEGWELLDKNSKSVLVSKEVGTITITAENGEELIYPAEGFEVRKTIGVGVDNILTVKNPDGKVGYLFLDKKGYWVTPIEQQTNPEVIEDYTHTELEDMWSGRVLYSELLSAQPFPSGTAVPDRFIYTLQVGPKGKFVDLVPFFEDSQYKDSNPLFQEMVNINNDYVRWIAFYKTQTPSGVEIIIGTQQVLSPDGKTSFFFHYAFGPEWPTDRDFKISDGTRINLIDSVFLTNNRELYNPDYHHTTMSPTIFFKGINPESTQKFFGWIQRGYLPPTAGIELYQDERDNPLLIKAGLDSMIQAALQNPDYKFGGNLPEAGDEINLLQYMFLLGRGHGQNPNYFSAGN